MGTIIECPYAGCDGHQSVEPPDDVWADLLGEYTYNEALGEEDPVTWMRDAEHDVQVECDRFDILPALKREDSTRWSLRFRVSSGFKNAFA